MGSVRIPRGSQGYGGRVVCTRDVRMRVEVDASVAWDTDRPTVGRVMADPKLASDVPIRDFVAALASPDSAQGTVSAATVAGAMGTSLLLMVAALPATRSE